MQITDIRMEKVNYKKVLANFDIVFDNYFVVHNVTLVKREDESVFISFYSRVNKEGKWINICHPINKRARAEIEETLINYYNEQMQVEQ